MNDVIKQNRYVLSQLQLQHHIVLNSLKLSGKVKLKNASI